MFLLALIIGCGVGIVVGALGAGGGIISVPVLVFILAQTAHSATMESLVIVGATALISIIPHSRSGNVKWKEGGLFGGLAVVSSVIGSRLSILVPGDILLYLFSFLLLGVAGFMYIRARNMMLGKTKETPQQNKIKLIPLLGYATMTGFLTGFFGVGGGFMVVPVLVLALGLGMRQASGTSLLVMIITAIAGLLARIGTNVTADWILVAFFVCGSIIGGLIGEKFTRNTKDYHLTFAFSGLLFIVAIFSIISTATGMHV